VIRTLALIGVLLPFWASAADLEVGGKAPAFKLLGVDGAGYSLEEHAGKRGVVVAWFPKAFTPG
jgi:peroxiredoxin Q/BCP